MSRNDSTDNRAKKFYDIRTAAELAGFSSRHFRKIIEEDHIPVLEIGSKMFIGKRDLEEWKSTRGEVRLDAALQQLDRWIREDAARTMFLETVSSEADF
jgi:excisionase family DNA binding protein